MVSKCKKQQHRISSSSLIVSLNKLHRETGIWTKPTATPLYDRKCLFSDSLEDEYHFNPKCNFYTELRKQYIPVHFTNNHSMLKLID